MRLQYRKCRLYAHKLCGTDAIFKAVYEGERQFSAIAVASDSENFTAPCGVCRQVLAEFCDAEMPVICINREGKYRILSLGELLPFAFSKKDME